ncbi:MAG: ABC transporter permease, partial [Melioribacteraceae bacterium]|nr:ABC transporter permease [Melioribacteraceae bacterium]
IPTFDFFDLMFSLFLPPILAASYYIFRNRLNFEINTNFGLVFITMFFVYSFLFAPLLTISDPNYQFNQRIARLISPFESIKYLEKNESDKTNGSFNYKNRIYFSSYSVLEDSIKVFQGRNQTIYNKRQIVFSDQKPKVFDTFLPFGTDDYGRCVYSRIIYGTRISISIGALSVFISFLVGLFLGHLAGIAGGITDKFLSRISDLFLAVPIIFFILFLLISFGNNFFTIVMVLGFSGWMSIFKLVKDETTKAKNYDFISTSRQLGFDSLYILIKDYFPIIIIPVTTNLVFQFANVILAESALSFLGLGISLEEPSWGAMIRSGQGYLNQAWWLIFFPSLTFVSLLITLKILGEKLVQHLNPILNDN